MHSRSCQNSGATHTPWKSARDNPPEPQPLKSRKRSAVIGRFQTVGNYSYRMPQEKP
jgi:hypothetical protein